MRHLAKGVLNPVLPEDLGSLKGGRRRTQQKETSHIGTKRDKSHWEHVSIAHRKIQKSSRSISGSGTGSGSLPSSGSGSGSRGRGRPSRAPRERGRGRDRGQSNLSAVKHASPCSTFPYTNAFPAFIYPFISNWKNVIDFVFGDEHQWPDVRRRILYELEHSTNLYVNLVGSEEHVNELVHRIHWLGDGPAPYTHWFETLDSLYIIANAFNLYDHPEDTLVIDFLTEERHFIQLQLNDMCPIPPLHV
ncbi:hypothetical protein M9H77_24087 [Catharanthus roseus]|uniref:Uncharacterized protein n=1 Tax=Catharanthus roseus TaxID=4058 RepID=A0ACC0AV42_CATRO|nr:hypothetical protein M9H77_24087 [Catharanthus roseus]